MEEKSCARKCKSCDVLYYINVAQIGAIIIALTINGSIF